jgi:hypothetical protein
MFGIENGLWEVDLSPPRSIRTSENRRSAEIEAILQWAQAPRRPVRAGPANFTNCCGLPAMKHRVADAGAELIGNLFGRSGPMFLASGPAPFSSPSRQKM